VDFYDFNGMEDYIFTALQHSLSAVLAVVSPSVCPSVCLSHAGTVSIWLMLRSWSLH